MLHLFQTLRPLHRRQNHLLQQLLYPHRRRRLHNKQTHLKLNLLHQRRHCHLLMTRDFRLLHLHHHHLLQMGR
jgi:hypothetical protein